MSPVAINGVDKQGVSVNAVQVKQALDAANETVDKGVYDPTTLSTVDGDLAVGNIKLGVTIFGFDGAVAPGIAFADYHHYEDLVGGATYTPTAQTLSVFCAEYFDVMKSDGIHVEFHDGLGWVDGYITTAYEKTCNVFQDNSQNLRIANGHAGARRTSLTGVAWS